MGDVTEQRIRMVDSQIAARGVRDRHVLDAMRTVPREAFVAPGDEGRAYDDGPLPIGDGQTISQPYIVALMIEAAAVAPGDAVLEIGAGSGYAAAVLAEIAARVDTVERHPALAEAAARRLAAAGYGRVTVHVGDGTLGLPEAAPFDAILVAAGGPSVPQALKEQLATGGRLVMPVGDATGQALLRVTRTGPDSWDETHVAAVRFVPLIGAQGWTEAGATSVPDDAGGPGKAR